MGTLMRVLHWGSKSVFGARGVNTFVVVLFKERVGVGLDKL